MTAAEQDVLKKLRALLATQVRLHQLILFGSRARGDADPESDMDVVVIVEEPVTSAVRRQISHCAWETGFDAGIVVTTVAYSRDEWENGPERASVFVQNVQREGILV